MPAQYNLPFCQALNASDASAYNKVPVWLAKLASQKSHILPLYAKLFDPIPWKQNMGALMTGVRLERAPIAAQTAYANALCNQPDKNVYSSQEVAFSVQPQAKYFMSNVFNFCAEFTTFLSHIKDTQSIIVEQMIWWNEAFIKTALLQSARYIYVVSSDPAQSGLRAAPTLPDGTLLTSANAPKNTGYLQQLYAAANMPMSFAAIDNACACLQNDLRAPFFTGGFGAAKDNQMLAGKYAWMTTSETFQFLKYDKNLLGMRDNTWNIALEGLKGSIYDQVVAKMDPYGFRVDEDGTFAAPETTDLDTKLTIGTPAFNQSGMGIDFLLGADVARVLKVGPPPAPFSQTISGQKFQALNWNGEVKLTDNVMVPCADGTLMTNFTGANVMLWAMAVAGILIQNPTWYLPIVYQRKRAALTN